MPCFLESVLGLGKPELRRVAGGTGISDLRFPDLCGSTVSPGLLQLRSKIFRHFC